MHYTDHPDEVAEEVFAGLSYMAQHNVPTNPNNIAVWYAYASGRYPDLCQTIDEMIAERRPFTEELCAHIYDKFFSMTRESALVEDASERIINELHRAQEYVATANEGTSRIGDRLHRYSSQLAGNESAAGIKSVIDHLIEETHALDAETGGLATNLGDVAGEIKVVTDQVLSDSHSLTAQAGQLADQLEKTMFEIREIERDFQEVREETLTDALTGVRNLKFFHMSLQGAIERARANDAPLGVLVIDLDHFSKFNQSYGRTVGDQVLRLIARTILECIKGQDAVGRIGGEEFAVMLPETAAEGTIKVAENIRAAFGRKTLTNRKTGERYGSITLSVGVAGYRPGESESQLLRRASEAMMSAKENGRDRVSTDD